MTHLSAPCRPLAKPCGPTRLCSFSRRPTAATVLFWLTRGATMAAAGQRRPLPAGSRTKLRSGRDAAAEPGVIADWTVEIGPQSPEIVVPWEGWVDLSRADLSEAQPGRRALTGSKRIPEASKYPELLPLLALANNGATLSSKVDVFPVTREEVDPEIAEAGLSQTACGLGSYLDLLLMPPAFAPGFKPYEEIAREAARRLEAVDLPLACAEIVIRPARLYDEDTFGLTLYSMGFGPDAQAARLAWQRAANAGVACLHQALRTHAGE